jgi:hypothetical protein
MSDIFIGKIVFQIIAVVSVLKLCACHEGAQPEHQPKHAVSSQSFVRHDVPMSYKFSSVHLYSSVKPEPYHNHQPVTPSHHLSKTNLLHKEIQYAPIIRDKDLQHTLHGAPVQETTQDKEDIVTIEKNNLEPKLSNHQEQLAYVPGYNIEILQSVNRYPGHNAVYRSYPHSADSEKLHKVNILYPFFLFIQ